MIDEEKIQEEATAGYKAAIGKSRDPVTVHLDYPIEYGDETITEVTLRRAKGKDVKALPPEPGVSDLLNLAGKLGGLMPKVLDELDASDAMKLVEVVNVFFGGSLMPDGLT